MSGVYVKNWKASSVMTQAFYDQWPGLFQEAHMLAGDEASRRLTILTPTIRPDGAIEVARSIQAAAVPPYWDIRHIIAYWSGPPDPSRVRVAAWFSDLLRQCAPGWIFVVDDDSRMHPAFLETLDRAAAAHPDAWAFLFGMEHKQVHNGILPARVPPRPGMVDGGQMVLWRDYAVREPWRAGATGDGDYLAALYTHAPDRWVAIPDIVCYHNHQVWG
jgi:hypothetical protein